MTGLKKMLVKEQNRLENIVAVMKNQLETAPEGSMRLSTSKNKISYYHYQVPCKSGGTYISRKNEVLIQKLAQKSYNEKVLSYAEKRLRYVRQLADIYEDSGIEEIFYKEHPARKKWISPIEPTWEQRVAEWSNEQYRRAFHWVGNKQNHLPRLFLLHPHGNQCYHKRFHLRLTAL